MTAQLSPIPPRFSDPGVRRSGTDFIHSKDSMRTAVPNELMTGYRPVEMTLSDRVAIDSGIQRQFSVFEKSCRGVLDSVIGGRSGCDTKAGSGCDVKAGSGIQRSGIQHVSVEDNFIHAPIELGLTIMAGLGAGAAYIMNNPTTVLKSCLTGIQFVGTEAVGSGAALFMVVPSFFERWNSSRSTGA